MHWIIVGGEFAIGVAVVAWIGSVIYRTCIFVPPPTPPYTDADWPGFITSSPGVLDHDAMHQAMRENYTRRTGSPR